MIKKTVPESQALIKQLMHVCESVSFPLCLALLAVTWLQCGYYLPLITDAAFHFRIHSHHFSRRTWPLSISLMHYKYPITTCWLALWGPVACWRTTLQTKLINSIIIRRTNGQATRTDWVISPHHVAPRPLSEPCLIVHNLLRPDSTGLS